MAAHLKPLEKDPVFDVIAVDDQDSRFRVFVPTESALSGVEFAIVRATHKLIEDYFGKPICKVVLPKCFETELCGRAVRLYGISKDDAFQEFRRAFLIEDREVIVPVVKNTELAVVIDQYIVSNLEGVFYRCCPRLPQDYVRPKKPSQELTDEERDLIEMEETIGIVERLKAQCMPLMKPDDLRPQELFDLLEDQVPRRLLGSFFTVIHLLDKRINIFKTIIASPEVIDNVPAYTALDSIPFVLGEEMLKRVKSTLPITWKLPRSQVGRVNRFVECKVRELTPRMPIGLSAPSESESALADEIRAPFSEFVHVRDYYLASEFLPVLLKVVHHPLSPYPRVEVVREAFKVYMEIEELVHYSTEKLFRLLDWAKRKPPRERDEIASKLEETSGWQEVLSVLQTHNFPDQAYTEQERKIFVLFFTTLLSYENELLMCEVPPLLDDEVEDVLDMIVDAVVLGQEEVCVLLDQPTPWDQLLEIERCAKETLDRMCMDAKIRLAFKPLWGGREVEVGALEMGDQQFDSYHLELLREQFL